MCSSRETIPGMTIFMLSTPINLDRPKGTAVVANVPPSASTSHSVLNHMDLIFRGKYMVLALYICSSRHHSAINDRTMAANGTLMVAGCHFYVHSEPFVLTRAVKLQPLMERLPICPVTALFTAELTACGAAEWQEPGTQNGSLIWSSFWYCMRLSLDFSNRWGRWLHIDHVMTHLFIHRSSSVYQSHSL